MALYAKLIHPDAILPVKGELRTCEDMLVVDGGVSARTGVVVTVPPGMRATVHSKWACGPRDAKGGEEIVVDMYKTTTDPVHVPKGTHVAELLFRFEDVVLEGDASEMGPLA